MDGSKPLPSTSEQTPQEWADAQAEQAGRLWIQRWPSGKDWEKREDPPREDVARSVQRAILIAISERMDDG